MIRCLRNLACDVYVIIKMGRDEIRATSLLMHAVDFNVSGQIGSVVAGGLILSLVPMFG